MTSSHTRAFAHRLSPIKWVMTSTFPVLLAGAVFADCANTHVRGTTAEKVEILFKNETDASINVLIQKADMSTPSQKKTVQSKTVQAGKKLDYTSSLGDKAGKRFYVSFLDVSGSDISGDFDIMNSKMDTANGISRRTEYSGSSMKSVRDSANVTCDTKFKDGRQRWSVSIQVDE